MEKEYYSYQSPGSVGPKTRKTSSVLEALTSALAGIIKSGDQTYIVGQEQEEETYTLAGRRYEPFKPEQMTLLQRMYTQREETRRFPNPFDNQPPLH